MSTFDIGGVCGHSNEDFWRQFDLYRLNGSLDTDLAMELRQTYGFKRMVMRSLLNPGFSDIGTVIMVATEHRREAVELVGPGSLADEFYHLGMPDNLGGGVYTRVISVGRWKDPEVEGLRPIGYVHECSREFAQDQDFFFNDFTQHKHFYVSPARVPYPGRKMRSLGQAYTPSVGHRYGSNEHA